MGLFVGSSLVSGQSRAWGWSSPLQKGVGEAPWPSSSCRGRILPWLSTGQCGVISAINPAGVTGTEGAQPGAELPAALSAPRSRRALIRQRLIAPTPVPVKESSQQPLEQELGSKRVRRRLLSAQGNKSLLRQQPPRCSACNDSMGTEGRGGPGTACSGCSAGAQTGLYTMKSKSGAAGGLSPWVLSR